MNPHNKIKRKIIFREQEFDYKSIKEVENELKSFDVIFCGYPFRKLSNILSFLIRFFQKLRHGYRAASYSHVAIISKEVDAEGNIITYVYEANPAIRKLKFKEWIDKAGGICIEVYSLNTKQLDVVKSNQITALHALRLNLGKRYDYVSLLIYQIIYILTGVWVGNKTSNAFYCSEYVAYVLSHLTNLKELVKWWSINPAKLYHILNRNGFSMKLKAYLNNK